jgi:hypothetical protein
MLVKLVNMIVGCTVTGTISVSEVLGVWLGPCYT